MLKDGVGYVLLVLALAALALGVVAAATHDYLAGALILATGFAVLRASVTLLRPSIGE